MKELSKELNKIAHSLAGGKSEFIIYQTWEKSINEDMKEDGYWALNTSGKGEVIAEIEGDIEKCVLFNSDCGLLNGKKYALRDILSFAKKGLHGLSIK